MSYLTYDEFKERGGALNETAFSRFAFAAEREVDRETFGRLREEDPVPEAVKQLVYELVLLGAKADFSADAVASESVGSWSKSYKDRAAEEYDTERQRLIITYLSGLTDKSGVPLLYRGC